MVKLSQEKYFCDLLIRYLSLRTLEEGFEVLCGEISGPAGLRSLYFLDRYRAHLSRA